MRRVEAPELLDDDLGTPQEIAQSFDDLWGLNRIFGGVSGTMKMLDRVLARRATRSFRILDAAAGDGRLASALHAEFGRRGVHAEFVALDRRMSHLMLAEGGPGELGRVAADAFALPFRNESFDLVISNLFLHHCPEERVPELLKGLSSSAREAVLINDLERSWILDFFLSLILPLAKSRLTKHDGLVSVRQAYTRRELESLVTKSGFIDYEIIRLPYFRMGLILWKRRAPRT